VAVIVVTRLRLKDPSLLNDFFAAAVALLEQAKNTNGNLGTDALAEANNTWWSSSVWASRDVMRGYVTTDPHPTMKEHLDEWCDEASFVDWEQESAELPGWEVGFEHLVADGYSADLTDASPANASRGFPAPVQSS
jgi:hypothetical protein